MSPAISANTSVAGLGALWMGHSTASYRPGFRHAPGFVCNTHTQLSLELEIILPDPKPQQSQKRHQCPASPQHASAQSPEMTGAALSKPQLPSHPRRHSHSTAAAPAKQPLPKNHALLHFVTQLNEPPVLPLYLLPAKRYHLKPPQFWSRKTLPRIHHPHPHKDTERLSDLTGCQLGGQREHIYAFKL